MFKRVSRNSRGSVRFAFSGFVIGALALIAGLGWHILSTQAASAGLSAPSARAIWTGSEGIHLSLSSTEVLTLTVLHTNDTWGYVDPCG